MKPYRPMNNDLRDAAKRAKVGWWQIAERLEISEPTMTRRLRHELPQDERERIFRIIEELKTEQEATE